ncbi:hypothetical protein CAEBREN_22268 [Caenorhabditis brenneri]|uniref:Uncharacterized protein n=1 Tax=Caenorhabditis brenneri TaxID=135651 RepID=G0MTH6_CAEBE|nr:hypothetical protein CAEBREN_22268 [Caenorhabditis brenneri]
MDYLNDLTMLIGRMNYQLQIMNDSLLAQQEVESFKVVCKVRQVNPLFVEPMERFVEETASRILELKNADLANNIQQLYDTFPVQPNA